jgi:tRNA uridine 5-carboxymethylaminomethyl modification enzyme
MFTSRAEFRLYLRIDNADERLTPLGRRAGLVNDARWALFEQKLEQKRRLREALELARVNLDRFEWLRLAFEDRPTLAEWLRRPEARIVQLRSWVEECLGAPPLPGVLASVETELKYAGYIAQQDRQVRRLHGAEGRRIPSGFDFEAVPGLSREIREKLRRVRPETLGQAGRIPGVTPAAVAVLDVYLTVCRTA